MLVASRSNRLQATHAFPHQIAIHELAQLMRQEQPALQEIKAGPSVGVIQAIPMPSDAYGQSLARQLG